MNLLEWWESHKRATRNAWILAAIDVVLLLGALLRLPLFTPLWEEILVGPLPDFYDLFVRQFIALIRDMGPGSVAVAGSTLSYLTGFATLLTIHVAIGVGVGYLFDHLSSSRWWSVTCYSVTVLVLAVMHLFVAYRTAIFFG
jgi:hypothetical protein